MKFARCLSCGFNIRVGDDPRLFQEIVCPGCGQHFVIIEIYPVEICYPLEDNQPQDPGCDLAYPAGEGDPVDY